MTLLHVGALLIAALLYASSLVALAVGHQVDAAALAARAAAADHAFQLSMMIIVGVVGHAGAGKGGARVVREADYPSTPSGPHPKIAP